MSNDMETLLTKATTTIYSNVEQVEPYASEFTIFIVMALLVVVARVIVLKYF